MSRGWSGYMVARLHGYILSGVDGEDRLSVTVRLAHLLFSYTVSRLHWQTGSVGSVLRHTGRLPVGLVSLRFGEVQAN